MTTLQGAVYAVAAADTTPSVGLLALLGAGTASVGLPCLLGGDSSEVPPAPAAPWAYLGFQSDVASISINTVDGVARWWLYDDRQWGYTRINAIAGRLLRLYPEATGHLFRDTVTQEEIWWQGAGLVGPEVAAQEYGQLLRWVDFPVRKIHAGMLAA